MEQQESHIKGLGDCRRLRGAGVTPESHEAALTTMKMCQIDVIND